MMLLDNGLNESSPQQLVLGLLNPADLATFTKWSVRHFFGGTSNQSCAP